MRAVVVEQLPRLGNGKLDLRQAAVLAAAPVAAAPSTSGTADVDGLCALLAEVLDVPEVRPDDTFVGLGGDSLSYVEASVRLEPLVGRLPPDWHITPVRELARQEAPPPGSGRLLETGVALRAAGIVAVVGSHTELVTLLGGAHVMLAVAGYNLARFCLSAASPWRSMLRAARGVAVPSVVAIAVAAVLTDRYTAVNVLLLNGVLGPREWTPTWHFWFVEVLVYLTLGAAALLAVPAVRRLEQRRPWGFALGLVAIGAASRFAPGWLPTGPDRIHTAHVVLWLFALGWAAARAGTTGRRLLLTAVVLLTVPGFFGDPQRDALVVAGVSALVWVRAVRVPAAVAVPVAGTGGGLAARLRHPLARLPGPRGALAARGDVRVARGRPALPARPPARPRPAPLGRAAAGSGRRARRLTRRDRLRRPARPSRMRPHRTLVAAWLLPALVGLRRGPPGRGRPATSGAARLPARLALARRLGGVRAVRGRAVRPVVAARDGARGPAGPRSAGCAARAARRAGPRVAVP